MIFHEYDINEDLREVEVVVAKLSLTEKYLISHLESLELIPYLLMHEIMHKKRKNELMN